MKFSANTIIVDADVGRAAGKTEHPVSKNSRVVLQAILANDLSVAFCKTMTFEWKKHASIFSQRWLSTMIARKKWKLIATEELIENYIQLSNLPDEKKAAALKDAHVVNGALQTDKFIASNDKCARGIFVEITAKCDKLNDVAWAIPAEEGEEIREVFTDRGFIPANWRLTTEA